MPLSAVDPDSIGGYRLLDRLGAGGMGVVYLACSSSGRQVAVKVVHAQLAENEEFRTRFKQEVAAVRKVSGAFTSSVVDADPDAELPWMATLYVPGRTLSDVVGEEGPLHAAEVRRLALGLVEALGDIHRAEVVHRDLKPANVLIAQDGPRVIDFGISRAADHPSFTTTGRFMGTPPFMSPEQLSRPREVTAASDVFSLGALLVYASTGHGPFDGDSAYVTMYQVVHEQAALDGVAEPLREIVERCLEKDPSGRPGLPELTRMLQELPEDGLPVARGTRERPRGTRERTGGAPARRVRRLRYRSAVAVLAAVAGLGACALLLNGVRGHDPRTEGSPPVPPAGVGTPSPELREAGLPAGWRPWRMTMPSVSGDSAFDSIEACDPGGLAVFCYGNDFAAARIDAASGHVDWRLPAAGAGSSTGIEVRDGRVLLSGPASPDGRDVDLSVLDADSGRHLWTKRVANIEAVFFGRAVLSSDGFQSGPLVARDAATGATLWSAPSPDGTDCVPQVFGDAPYGVCSGRLTGETTLLRLDPRNGTPQRIARLKAVTDPAGLDGHDLLQLAWDKPLEESYASVVRVDVRTGSRRTVTLPSRPAGRTSLTASRLFFVQDTGRVTAVDPSTGEQLWSQDTGVDLLGEPVASEREGVVYLSSYSGRLLALDLETGRKRWQTAAMSTTTSGDGRGFVPMRAGGSVVTLADGRLRSVDPLHPAAGPRPAGPVPPPSAGTSAPAARSSYRRGSAAGPGCPGGRGEAT